MPAVSLHTYIVALPENHIDSLHDHNITAAITVDIPYTSSYGLYLSINNDDSFIETRISQLHPYALISPDQPYTWQVNRSVLLTSPGINTKFLNISSTAELVVTLTYMSYINEFEFSSDTILLSSTGTLSTYYVIETGAVASPQLLYYSDVRELPNSLSYIVVMATDDGVTDVKLKFPHREFDIQAMFEDMTICVPRTMNSSLEQFQSLFLRFKQDVSGTLVTSTKKIAVFAGTITVCALLFPSSSTL